MQREDVIRTLQRQRDELAREFGVKSLALFGSVARGDATSDSDVDILVEFDSRPVGLFHLARLHARLRELLNAKQIDLALRDSIYPALQENILGEAIDVFTAEVGAAR